MRSRRRCQMAKSRSVPTDLWEDPAVFRLSDEVQYILVKLVLKADDYGRGLADMDLLAHKLHASIPLLEQALQALEERRLLICYQVEEYRYYALTRWREWETLSKPTPSIYPAPPAEAASPVSGSAHPTGSRKSQVTEGQLDTSAQLEVEEKEQVIEQKEEQQEMKEEGPSSNESPIPATCADTNAARSHSQKMLLEKTRAIATILRLPVDAALTRIVEEYLP